MAHWELQVQLYTQHGQSLIPHTLLAFLERNWLLQSDYIHVSMKDSILNELLDIHK